MVLIARCGVAEASPSYVIYAEDLAHIHDVGFNHHARGAAPAIVRWLGKGRLTGTVCDLGCGGGQLSQALVEAGYEVLGVDVSQPLLQRARLRVPEADFVMASLWTHRLPRLAAITAVGEPLNYRDTSRHRSLQPLLQRFFRSLLPGGRLVFDVVMHEAVPEFTRRSFVQTDDWSVLVETSRASIGLRRNITCFRCNGRSFRRSQEVHWVQTYGVSEVLADLRSVGFRAFARRSYGDSGLLPGRRAFFARRPE